jgi:hypothetical protein
VESLMRNLITIMTITVVISLGSYADGILVFMPTTIPVAKIEKKVKSVSSHSVTVFAKYSDFEVGIEAMKPDFVLSVDAFDRSNGDFIKGPDVPVSGKTKANYILLSLDPSWKSKDVSEARVGAVEVIKRTKMKAYMDGLFSKPFKGIKTVSKAEDLYPLLIFKTVDVIAVLPYVYEELREKFNTVVHEVGTSHEISILNVYSRKGKEIDEQIENIKRFEYKEK